MKLLVLGDEKKAPYHPLGRMLGGIYQSLHEEGELTVSVGYQKLSLDELKKYDGIISYIDCYQSLGGYDDVLADYIEQGGRYLALHNGILTAEGSRLEAALGGNFVTHPAYCQLTYYLRGEKLFTIGEEPYMVRQTDERNQVFLEFSLEGKRYPAGWYRRSQKGFAAYLAPGHDERTGENAGFQKLLRQTLRELLERR